MKNTKRIKKVADAESKRVWGGASARMQDGCVGRGDHRLREFGPGKISCGGECEGSQLKGRDGGYSTQCADSSNGT